MCETWCDSQVSLQLARIDRRWEVDPGSSCRQQIDLPRKSASLSCAALLCPSGLTGSISSGRVPVEHWDQVLP